jgi:hypothetical protein
MRVMKTLCCAAVLALAFAPGARADQWNKKTILTFSGPVQIPGVTLPAGSYVFKLADLSSNRHVVQVFDKDEKKVYGTLLAIPDERLEPTSDPVVLFAERPASMPQAIRAWFYPGERIGNEFVYPRTQAMKIAKETHKGVLSMEEPQSTTTAEDRMEAMKSAKVSRIDESGRAAEEDKTATTTATTGNPTTTTGSRDEKLKNSSGKTGTSAEATTAGTTGRNEPAPTATAGSRAARPQTANAQATTSRRNELPQTASNLPLFELLSVLCIAAALAVHRLRARAAVR